MGLLIIGGVAAGLSAAARARRIDPSLPIAVLEQGPAVSYGACGLPYFLEGRVARADDLVVHTPEYFRERRNIAVRTGARVVSIAHPRREVTLAGGERVPYTSLVVATGARPRTVPIAGPAVFALHTLEDAGRLKDYLRQKQPRRALIVGAGYIGLEAADALQRNGLGVTIVERGAHVLGRGDAALTAAVRERLERSGVELQLNAPLPDAASYDLALVAAGLQPNVELASEAGVELGLTGAIRADERMRTNLPGVYAAGDCAETTHLVTGRPAYIPLGTTANKMGRVAGANAAGRRERFAGVVGTAIVNIFGLGVAFAGLSVEQARREAFSPLAARASPRRAARITSAASPSPSNWWPMPRRAASWAARFGGKTAAKAASTSSPPPCIIACASTNSNSWTWPTPRPSPPCGIRS